ncbi:unnamed protein product [Caenorhabditis angaria]|uniref:Uncharacterized protein n=1 Tax=Caenorhabditis angaria TaxID=860376 RepID=A0A9P1J183_9PELO|nr:unnamed protein product [Caenorhabditis angaria]
MGSYLSRRREALAAQPPQYNSRANVYEVAPSKAERIENEKERRIQIELARQQHQLQHIPYPPGFIDHSLNYERGIHRKKLVNHLGPK